MPETRIHRYRDERLPKGPRFASESLDADTGSGSVSSKLTHYLISPNSSSSFFSDIMGAYLPAFPGKLALVAGRAAVCTRRKEFRCSFPVDRIAGRRALI